MSQEYKIPLMAEKGRGVVNEARVTRETASEKFPEFELQG